MQTRTAAIAATVRARTSARACQCGLRQTEQQETELPLPAAPLHSVSTCPQPLRARFGTNARNRRELSYMILCST